MLTCSADGCDRAPHCRGMCSMHYQFAKRHGHIQPLQGKRMGDCLTCADIAHIAGYDNATNIARRVGLGGKQNDHRAREALYRHLRRHGQTDLLDRIIARETIE